jgi:hypothetical protein
VGTRRHQERADIGRLLVKVDRQVICECRSLLCVSHGEARTACRDRERIGQLGAQQDSSVALRGFSKRFRSGRDPL